MNAPNNKNPITQEELHKIREEGRVTGQRISDTISAGFCDLCSRKPGLPLYPARYAVAPLPGNGGPLFPVINNHSQLQITEPGLAASGRAGYTLRELRPGYFYIWVQRRGDKLKSGWMAFRVFDEGLFWPYDPQASTINVPDDDLTGKGCLIANNHLHHARYITLPEPESIIRIWYVWSNVRWLRSQFDSLGGDGGNGPQARQYMQQLDIQAWRGSQNAPHTASIEQLNHLVAGFAIPNLVYKRPELTESHKNIFQNLSQPPKRFNEGYCQRYGPQSGGILEAIMRKTGGTEKPLILGANDPLAMTQDLAILTQSIFYGDDNTEVVRNWWSNVLLNALETGLEGKVKKTYDRLAQVEQEMADKELEGYRINSLPHGPWANESLNYQQIQAKRRQLEQRTQARLKRYAALEADKLKEEWTKLTPYLDQGKWDFDALVNAKKAQEAAMPGRVTQLAQAISHATSMGDVLNIQLKFTEDLHVNYCAKVHRGPGELWSKSAPPQVS